MSARSLFSRYVVMVVGCLSLASSPANSQEIGKSLATKDNLDLPLEARAGEIEDTDEQVGSHIFYTQLLEGDGIFYVIDRSSSSRDGELAVAKQELVRNISEFSEDVQFGIVFFDAEVSKFPSSGRPAKATKPMKAAAISFVQSTQAGHGSCCSQALAEGLRMANISTARRKVLVYLGDGGGTCHGAQEAEYLRMTLAAVTALNYQRIQINAIGILNPGRLQENFMKQLAASNGGTYTRVQH